jgi:hypothetical protein
MFELQGPFPTGLVDALTPLPSSNQGGAENFQVARRLRAMINNLTGTLPEWRQPALRRELELLDRSIEQLYVFPEDRAMARTPDMQGLGGASNH